MDNTEHQLLSALAAEALVEQRRRRRWGIFFKLLFFAYLIFITALFLLPGDGAYGGASGKGHAKVIQIDGEITADGFNSAYIINSLLSEAFADSATRAVILEINSPGGSAVESNRIYTQIRRLQEKYPDTPVYAVAGDYCASGGYFIASAADEIFADPASLVGSIGVIFSGFGFADTLEKLGVERRVYSAGGDKSMLDAFSPQRAEDVARIKQILNDIHEVFVKAVKDGREGRIHDAAEIYNGALFSGAESLELGLIDGFNDVGGVVRDKLGEDYRAYYMEKTFWFEEALLDFVSQFRGALSGVSMRAR